MEVHLNVKLMTWSDHSIVGMGKVVTHSVQTPVTHFVASFSFYEKATKFINEIVCLANKKKACFLLLLLFISTCILLKTFKNFKAVVKVKAAWNQNDVPVHVLKARAFLLVGLVLACLILQFLLFTHMKNVFPAHVSSFYLCASYAFAYLKIGIKGCCIIYLIKGSCIIKRFAN